MKQERLFRAIGDVGDDLIERAATPMKRNTAWVRWGALAACLVLVIGVAAYLPSLFGAKSAAPMAANERSTADAAVPQAEMPEEIEPETPAEAPAEAIIEEDQAPREEPAAQACSTDLLSGPFTSAHLQLDDMVVELEGEELEALLAQLRALPQEVEEPFCIDVEPLEIRFYDETECMAAAYLPSFSVAEPEQSGESCLSEEAMELYESLVERYF